MGLQILVFCAICGLILIFSDVGTGRINGQENLIRHRNYLPRRANDYLFPLYSASEERPSFVGFPTPGNLMGIRSESPYGPNLGHARFSSYIGPMLPSRRIRWRGFRHTNQGEVIDLSDIADFVHVLGSINWTDSDSAQFLASTETFAFESMLNLLFSKIVELQSDELRETGLNLLQKYSPPKSLIDATKAWTTEQKAQVRLLVTGSRTRELHIVLDGLITSLPDEDQRQITLLPAIDESSLMTPYKHVVIRHTQILAINGTNLTVGSELSQRRNFMKLKSFDLKFVCLNNLYTYRNYDF